MSKSTSTPQSQALHAAMIERWLTDTPCTDGQRHDWRGYDITRHEDICRKCDARRSASIHVAKS